MIEALIRRFVLRKFFGIALTGVERELAEDAVVSKYVVAVRQSVIYSILMLPALVLLDTNIVVSVLIPTTMVAGTAWFSVSLASLKKKFEGFGTELTTNLFVAFTLALSMLFLSTAFSLTEDLWKPRVLALHLPSYANAVSACLSLLVVGKLLLSIFKGSLQYDINDAMLTGQNEAAERFFKKSLSLLNEASNALKLDRGLEVANYTIGVAFFEVYTNIKEEIEGRDSAKIDIFIGKANKLISSPAMSQKQADDISRELIREFLRICLQSGGSGSDLTEEIRNHKSFGAVEFELGCLDENEEDQQMVDTRMSVIFSEIANLIDVFGPQLFSKN